MSVSIEDVQHLDGFDGEEAVAALVVGVGLGDLSWEESAALALWAEERGLVALPGGDSSEEGETSGDVVVGVPVVRVSANEGPSEPFDDGALASARATALAALQGVEHPLLEDAVARLTTWLVACGPLASAQLAYGRRSADGAIVGTTMEQERHGVGVDGVRIASVAAGVGEVGRLEPEASCESPEGYFLVAGYD